MNATSSTNVSGVERARARQPVPALQVGLVYPWVGLVATAGCTVLAMYLVPMEFVEPGQLQLPAVILAAGLAAAPLIAALQDIRSLVRAENILAAAPIYWLLLDLIQARYGFELARREDIIKAFAATGLFSAGVWLSMMQRPWRMPRFVQQFGYREISGENAFLMALACFGLGVFYYLYMADFDWTTIRAGLSQMRLGAAWNRDSVTGDWKAFIEHLAYFGMLLPSLAVVIGTKSGWINVRTFVAWSLATTYALFQAQGGNRRYLGVMFGAALIVWLISSKSKGMRKLLLLTFWTGVILVMMEVVLQYRGKGMAIFADEEERENLAQIDNIRVDDNFLRLAQSIYYVPEQSPYVWHEYAYFAIIRPIPRVFWPGKPTAPSFRIQDYIEIGASLSSSVVGELYISGGLLVVFIGGWLYGRLGNWASQLLSEPKTLPQELIYAASVMALFAGCRSMQDLVMMSYVTLALLVILALFKNQLITVTRKPGGTAKELRRSRSPRRQSSRAQ